MRSNTDSSSRTPAAEPRRSSGFALLERLAHVVAWSLVAAGAALFWDYAAIARFLMRQLGDPTPFDADDPFDWDRVGMVPLADSNGTWMIAVWITALSLVLFGVMLVIRLGRPRGKVTTATAPRALVLRWQSMHEDLQRRLAERRNGAAWYCELSLRVVRFLLARYSVESNLGVAVDDQATTPVARAPVGAGATVVLRQVVATVNRRGAGARFARSSIAFRRSTPNPTDGSTWRTSHRVNRRALRGAERRALAGRARFRYKHARSRAARAAKSAGPKESERATHCLNDRRYQGRPVQPMQDAGARCGCGPLRALRRHVRSRLLESRRARRESPQGARNEAGRRRARRVRPRAGLMPSRTNQLVRLHHVDC